MINVTFKNVGQGDSIILKWEQNSLPAIGIIDCKKNGKVNPVLEEMIDERYTSIKFLLLSHPHSDHCSGFTELLRYCIDNRIKIDRFFYTSNNMPTFWKAAAKTPAFESELLLLFKTMREARDTIGMKLNVIEGDGLSSINFNDEIRMDVLAPRSKESDNYARNFTTLPIEEDNNNNPSANWLASLLKIYTEDWYLLLTSDVENTVLVDYHRIGVDAKRELVLSQAPHHGAIRNHKSAFWKKMKRKNETPIIISVGKNSYGHPSKDVVDFFTKNDYKLYSTNQVGALLNVRLSSFVKKKSNALNTFSTSMPIVVDQFNGDKSFNIDRNGNVTHNVSKYGLIQY